MGLTVCSGMLVSVDCASYPKIYRLCISSFPACTVGTGGNMKPLEQMNIVDDFLAGSLIGHKEYGEAASRYILSCILNRKIGKLNVVTQKFLIGDNPERHGIRLDVYLDEEDGEIFDVEPDKNNNAKDIASLPKRARFYHDKIDTANLSSGSNYDDLRNVIVIFIMPYDPFGLSRMVYTVKKSCVEVPDMPYDDGDRTIFLYTGGTEGHPTEQLRQLLHYMENSVEENACTKELQELHKMVVAVKQDGEVGLAYMKSFEIEEKIRQEGIEEGEVSGTIRTCRRLGQTDEQIIALLQEDSHLTREQAEEALAKYTSAH